MATEDLELELNIEVGCRIGGGTSLSTLLESFVFHTLSWHILMDVRFGGGGCREDVQ